MLRNEFLQSQQASLILCLLEVLLVPVLPDHVIQLVSGAFRGRLGISSDLADISLLEHGEVLSNLSSYRFMFDSPCNRIGISGLGCLSPRLWIQSLGRDVAIVHHILSLALRGPRWRDFLALARASRRWRSSGERIRITAASALLLLALA